MNAPQQFKAPADPKERIWHEADCGTRDVFSLGPPLSNPLLYDGAKLSCKYEAGLHTPAEFMPGTGT
jgi:hypothetical protein